MKFKKDDIYGLAGSILFHLLIFLILWFTVLRTEVPNEEEGVLVNFGNIDMAAGLFEPRYTGSVLPSETTPPPPVSHPDPAPEELITQDLDESISLNDGPTEEERRREEERRKHEQEEREQRQREEEEHRRQEEQRRQQEAISNRVAGAFGSGNEAATSQGDAETGVGNQGSPFGNSDQGANEGVGGFGSFSLNERSIGSGGLPRPAYTVQEEGKIVIDITVDPKGNVIDAKIGKGTNIDNASMRQSALEAARKAKFSRISGANNQSGTITYQYKLN
ncbi:MAG: energy transducer TonB [Tannerellaceae bacterium]|nr:energy transducer TonB [Tannerellaceae bacterium]